MIRFFFYPLFYFCLQSFPVSGASMSDSLRYHVEHYTDEHGLPQNSINGIGVDEYGFVWLATEGGITRFDGRNFKPYDSRMLGLKSNRIKLIRYVSESGKLFGLNGHFEKFLLSKGRPWHISHTPEDISNNPAEVLDEWFQDATGLPTDYMNTGEDLFRFDGIAGGNYIVSPDTIFYYDRNHQIQFRTPFHSNNFHQFFLLDEKLLHFDPSGQFTSIAPPGKVVELTIHGDIIRDQKELKEVKIFWNMGTTDVFLYVDQAFYQLKFSENQQSLNTVLILKDFDFDQHEIYSAHYDQAHRRIFLGSKTKGLYVFNRLRFRAVNAGPLAHESLFYSQLPYGTNQLLTSQGYIFSDTGLVHYLPEITKATESRRSMIHDRNGNIWTTSSWKSIYQFTADGRTKLHEKNTPEAVSCMLHGLEGDLWLGTFSDGDGIYAYDMASDTFRHFPGIQDEITCLLQQSRDTMLVGSLSSGLLRVHIPSGAVDTLSELKGRSIRSLYEDENENLWITTYDDGFFLLQGRTKTHFPLDEKQYLQSAHCILEDTLERFWITTNQGLFLVKKNELLAYAQDSTRIPSYIHFNKIEGFNTNEFNGGCQPCGVTTPDGLFSFPSMNGLVLFRPELIQPEVPDQKIIIDNIEVDGESMITDDTMVINQGFRQIKISYSTAFFGNPYNLHLEYQIRNPGTSNTDWFQLENEAIFLNDLNSGTHEVVVRSANLTAPTEFGLSSLLIQVPPLFYETWWFMSLCLIALFLLFWGFYQWRSHRIRMQNLLLQQKVDSQTRSLQDYVTELERSEGNLIRQTNILRHLSAAISHDIKSPLSFIVQAQETITEGLATEKHQLASYSQATHSSILQVYEYVNNLTKHTGTYLTYSKPKTENVNLHLLIEKKLEFFKPLATQNGNVLINTLRPSSEMHTNAELMSIVIHNLIDNANKNCTDGTITISTNQSGPVRHIEVSDTGSGMDPMQVQNMNSGRPVDSLESGLGLHIIHYLSTILECRFTIKSTLGQGSRAILNFDKDQPIKGS